MPDNCCSRLPALCACAVFGLLHGIACFGDSCFVQWYQLSLGTLAILLIRMCNPNSQQDRCQIFIGMNWMVGWVTGRQKYWFVHRCHLTLLMCGLGFLSWAVRSHCWRVIKRQFTCGISCEWHDQCFKTSFSKETRLLHLFLCVNFVIFKVSILKHRQEFQTLQLPQTGEESLTPRRYRFDSSTIQRINACNMV